MSLVNRYSKTTPSIGSPPSSYRPKECLVSIGCAWWKRKGVGSDGMVLVVMI